MSESNTRPWTYVGLGIALLAMPLVIALFNVLRIPWTTQNVVLRELTLFAGAGALALIIRRKERLPWASVGLQRPAAGSTARWVGITIVGVALALAIACGVIKLAGWSVWSG